MVMESESPVQELWQVIQEGADPIIEEIQQIEHDTAKRIKDKIDFETPPSYLKPYFQAGFYEPEVFMTDRPEKIFGGNETIYTITSSLALENMKGEEVLTPPSEHSPFAQDIQTHRGIGLALFSKLMNGLGFKLGAKDSFLWLGPNLDGEQFVLEDAISKSGRLVDEKIATQIFNHADIKNGYSTLQIHPLFRRILTSINDGQILYGSDPQIRTYIDNLLDILHRYTGVREGWFNSLEGIFKGTIPPKKRIDPTDMDLSLTFTAHELAQPSPRTSQAVILEVDASKLINRTPIFPFPLTSRPPETIVPSPHLPFDAVKAVYAETPLDSLKRFGKPIKNIAELPDEKWLKDADENVVTPIVARRNGVNPRSPVCALRYSRSPISVWAEHLENGDMAPWGEIPYVDLTPPNTFVEHALKSIILKNARKSRLLDRVTQITKDQNIAETRILSEATNKMALPSIKHVR